MSTPPTPVRLRLSHAKGFNLQALSRATNGLPAVNCASPGKWRSEIGRPFSRNDAVRYFKAWLDMTPNNPRFMKETNTQTTGLTLLLHVWENRKTTSWSALNHSMRLAIRLAIGSQMKFERGDLAYVSEHMRPSYWLGENLWEDPYALAVEVDNRSAIQAIELYLGRKPFIANDVIYRRWGGGSEFLRGCHGRQRGRLALGFHIGSWKREVTSIHRGHIIVCESEQAEGQPKRIVKRNKWTREDLAKLFPVPKKAKTPTPPA